MLLTTDQVANKPTPTTVRKEAIYRDNPWMETSQMIPNTTKKVMVITDLITLRMNMARDSSKLCVMALLKTDRAESLPERR